MSRADTIISRLPGFYQSQDRQNVLYRLMEVFGKELDGAEEDLIRVMRAHWVNTSDNEDSKGFDTSEKGDLDKIFSLYVEALGGTSLLKQAGRRSGADGKEDDKIYRERIKGLIRVLRDGPSTREGIAAIVAANLGIVGDSTEAVAARSKIRIEEYLPIPYGTQSFQRDLSEVFLVENPNYVHTTPTVRVNLPIVYPSPLVNPTLINSRTGSRAQYTGIMLPGQRITFFADGSGMLDGQVIPLSAPTPLAQPGYNAYRFEAGIGMPEGYFDVGRFDFVRFEQSQVNYYGIFDHPSAIWDASIFSNGSPVVHIDVDIVQLTPGTFRVRIPWDIEGYTEVLDKLADKPREQIRYIVDKVKAAGIYALINYEKNFKELHEMEIGLTIQDHMPPEVHDMAEADFDIMSIAKPYAGGLQHDMQDQLTLSGVFDRTRFDSLNTFA